MAIAAACSAIAGNQVPLACRILRTIKTLMVVDGGPTPLATCALGSTGMGYIGMEKEAEDTISGWIRSPTP